MTKPHLALALFCCALLTPLACAAPPDEPEPATASSILRHADAQATADRARQIRARRQAFRRLPPEQRRKVLRAYRQFKALPEDRRRALRQQWRRHHPRPPAKAATPPVPSGPASDESRLIPAAREDQPGA